MANEKGFTLVELMVAMAIGLIILPLGYLIIFSGTKAHLDGIDEYQLQSDMRVAAEHLNNITRYSTVVFAVTEDDFDPITNGVGSLSKGWNYIGSCPFDGIVQYHYDSTSNSHIKTILIENKPNITFSAEFIDKNPDVDDKLLKFILEGIVSGSSRISIETELKALNSLQVVDRGHEFNRSIALAYRSDPRPVAENSHAAVSMVLDVSGSMDWGMGGQGSSGDKRIDILKSVAIEFVEQLEHSSACLVPFSRTANDHTSFFNVDTEESGLITEINNFSASGGTNTGDGLRRGYHQLDYFNNNKETYGVNDKDILNYMVVLVDGVTNMASAVLHANDTGSYWRGDFVEYIEDASDVGTTWYVCITRNSGTHRFSRENASGSYTDTSLRRVIGHGNDLDIWGENYVNHIGDIITNSSYNIKTFVIGFSDVPEELDSVEDIANAIDATSSVEGVNYYIATDQAQLEAIFEDIGGQILADLWHVSGP